MLDHLEVNPADDCLDVGCGYGVLGMTLARLAPQGRSVMVDKDSATVMKSMMSGNLAGLGSPGGPMIRTKKSGWMAPKDRNKKKKRR